MSIISHDDWNLSEKGMKDAQRHRDKIDDQIRKNIKDVIGEESIITKKDGKMVRIPIKGLKDYRFVYGMDDNVRGGVGQGEGKAGDTIARKPGQGDANDRKPGDQKGEDFMETEVDIDYLIEIMFEDLGLPYIEEKQKAEQLVPVGWKFETISKVGIQPRVHKNRTMKETIKRTAGFVAEIMDATKCEEDNAYRALSQSEGDLIKAIEIINTGILDMSIDPSNVYIEDEDMRYKQLEEEVEYHSNAVVIAMMDVSGSMDAEKKYLARSLLFWLSEFLKKAYQNVQIKFIVHTTEAWVVDEDEFFHKGESGGTMCHTAIDLAMETIESEFPISKWNVYGVYISDGEDFDMSKTVKSMKNMIDMKVNMLSYIEIALDNYPTYGGKSLLDVVREKFDFKTESEGGTNFYKNDEQHFLACTIKNKKHVYPALRHMLFERQIKK